MDLLQAVRVADLLNQLQFPAFESGLKPRDGVLNESVGEVAEPPVGRTLMDQILLRFIQFANPHGWLPIGHLSGERGGVA